jgi:hypothetical protein
VSLRSYFTFCVEMSVTYVSLRSYFTFCVEMSVTYVSLRYYFISNEHLNMECKIRT